MTNEEIEAWLAIRREAGKAINPATAKVASWHTVVDNVYGIFPDSSGMMCRAHFARAPGSDVWVWFNHLPESVRAALWKRLERNDPDGPSLSDPDLPNVKKLVVEIMARDDGEPGYALSVARGIAAHLGQSYPDLPETLKCEPAIAPDART